MDTHAPLKLPCLCQNILKLTPSCCVVMQSGFSSLRCHQCWCLTEIKSLQCPWSSGKNGVLYFEEFHAYVLKFCVAEWTQMHMYMCLGSWRLQIHVTLLKMYHSDMSYTHSSSVSRDMSKDDKNKTKEVWSSLERHWQSMLCFRIICLGFIF